MRGEKSVWAYTAQMENMMHNPIMASLIPQSFHYRGLSPLELVRLELLVETIEIGWGTMIYALNKSSDLFIRSFLVFSCEIYIFQLRCLAGWRWETSHWPFLFVIRALSCMLPDATWSFPLPAHEPQSILEHLRAMYVSHYIKSKCNLVFCRESWSHLPSKKMVSQHLGIEWYLWCIEVELGLWKLVKWSNMFWWTQLGCVMMCGMRIWHIPYDTIHFMCARIGQNANSCKVFGIRWFFISFSFLFTDGLHTWRLDITCRHTCAERWWQHDGQSPASD